MRDIRNKSSSRPGSRRRSWRRAPRPALCASNAACTSASLPFSDVRVIDATPRVLIADAQDASGSVRCACPFSSKRSRSASPSSSGRPGTSAARPTSPIGPVARETSLFRRAAPRLLSICYKKRAPLPDIRPDPLERVHVYSTGPRRTLGGPRPTRSPGRGAAARLKTPRQVIQTTLGKKLAQAKPVSP